MNPLRVLVIDDDRDLVTTLRDILELAGYEVATANQGQYALELARTIGRTPMVALVDLGLPDISGLEVATRLQELSEATQVVILTANTSVDSAIEALRHRSTDYLLKPVDPRHLLRILEQAVERSRRFEAEQALQRERKRMSDIFEASPVGMALLGSDGALEHLNRAAAQTLGVPAPLTPEKQEATVRRVERWLSGWLPEEVENGHDVVETERTFIRDDGAVRTLSFRARRLRSIGGEIDGVLLVMSDVTEHRELEERLRRAQKLEAIGRLAGGVSHDFNNLATIVLTRSELLLAEVPPDWPYLEDLVAIRDSCRHAAEVARQLLAFGRRQESRLQPVDLNEVVRGVRALLERNLEAGIVLEERLADPLPAVAADPAQLRQVVLNLAFNARDAMPDGGALTLRSGEQAPGDPPPMGAEGSVGDGGWVFLEVTDTGIGMDEATRSRLFEPFFTTKREGEGTGLGLPTVYGIVSQAGGLVEVDSVEGAGSTFRVWLPAAGPAVEAVSAAVDTSGASPIAQKRRTILVVDDDDGIRAVARRILAREGHQVLEASHGREALDVARRYPGTIHLLLTDYHMPGLSVEEYVPHLLRARPLLRVVVMSGSRKEEIDIELGEHGVPALFVQKPFDVRDLQVGLREVLRDTA